MTAAPSPSKKRSLLRKFLYLAAAAVLLGSLLLSYMQWEANTLRFRETQAPAGCLPGLSGLRILVLSDVHTGLPMLEEAVHMAEQAKPDMIVFLETFTRITSGPPMQETTSDNSRSFPPSLRPTRAWATMTWPWPAMWNAS